MLLTDFEKTLLESLITIISITIATIIIIWRIGKEFRNSLVLQRDNHREKLKLDIYREISNQILIVEEKSLVGSYGQHVPIQISIKREQSEKFGIKPSLPTERVEKISQEVHEFHHEVAQLMSIIEQYEIVSPALKIFNKAFSCALHDAGKSHDKFQNFLFKYLPIDLLDADKQKLGPNVIVPAIPNENELEDFKKAGDLFFKDCITVSDYAHDLRVEAQNLLLGQVFQSRAKRREPLDPNIIVISTDDNKIVELEKYFMEKTAWGKAYQKYKKEFTMDSEGS